MKISPADVQRQAFAGRLRGFDRDEVRSSPNIMAEEVAPLQRERDSLAQSRASEVGVPAWGTGKSA